MSFPHSFGAMGEDGARGGRRKILTKKKKMHLAHTKKNPALALHRYKEGLFCRTGWSFNYVQGRTYNSVLALPIPSRLQNVHKLCDLSIEMGFGPYRDMALASLVSWQILECMSWSPHSSWTHSTATASIFSLLALLFSFSCHLFLFWNFLYFIAYWTLGVACISFRVQS